MTMMQKSRLLYLLVVFLMITLSCSLFESISPASPTPFPTPEIITPVSTPAIHENSESLPETQITQEPKEETVLSVAYVKDGNVWLWQKGGAALPLTSSGNVSRLILSTDGKVVAFERTIDDQHSELWSVNSDGSGEHQLISVDEFNNFDRDKWLEYSKSLVPYHFDFIPNTHILAYNTRQTFEGPGLVIFDDLRLVNTDTHEKMTLLPSGQGGEFVYSPDGQEIAISTSTKISLVHTDGTNRREVLNYTMIATYSEYSYYAAPIWAADSSSLRVAIPPADPLGDPRQPTTLWSIPVDGNPATQIGSIMAAPFSGVENAFSPDFSKIMYTSEITNSDQNLSDLHLADSNSANDITLLSNQYVAFNNWAPDSQHFMIIAGEPSSVQLGDFQANFQPLTLDSDVVANVLWVDANRIIYAKGVNETWELRLGVLDGTSEVIDTIQSNLPQYDYANH
ncbi:MAG: hypothetical protein JW908_08950 [Anaerolineales bacterium]|nr:hypothetical protein [Anaerolineales bacterium]